MSTTRGAPFQPHATAYLCELLKKEIKRYQQAPLLDLNYSLYEVTYLGELVRKSIHHRYELVLFGRSKEANDLVTLNRQLLKIAYNLVQQYYTTFQSSLSAIEDVHARLCLITLYRHKIENSDLHLNPKIIEEHWKTLGIEIESLYQMVQQGQISLDKVTTNSIMIEHSSHSTLTKTSLSDYFIICALDFINLVNLDGEVASYKKDIIKDLMTKAEAMDSSSTNTPYYQELVKLLNNPPVEVNDTPAAVSFSTSVIAAGLGGGALFTETQRLETEKSVYFHLYDIHQYIQLPGIPTHPRYSQYHGYDWDDTLIRFNHDTEKYELLHEDLWIAHFKNNPSTRRNDIVTAAPYSPYLEYWMLMIICELNEKVGNPRGTNTLFHSLAFATGRNKEPFLRYLKEKELPELNHQSFYLIDDRSYNEFLCKRGGFSVILANPKGQPTHFKALDILNQEQKALTALEPSYLPPEETNQDASFDISLGAKLRAS